MRFQGKAVVAVALLIVTTMATGCPALSRAIRPQSRKCERVWSHPRIASLLIYGEGGWRYLKDWEAGRTRPRSANYGPGGLSVVSIFEKNGVRVMGGGRDTMISNPYRCEHLSARALTSATDAFERLASGLSARKPPAGEGRELLQLHRVSNDDWKWGAVDELSPEELDAVRTIVCLAHEALGRWTERAVRNVGPKLTARLGFPATCTVSQEESRTDSGLAP